ncbi:hypothetical protein LEP1GSC043_3134 [Leptospira weilii str. Ecochallenge]|uniref:Lipoprotein n=1 Tax=Leptospira weilii str. Ecochallenge TaxID=1049986 RepID=N1U1X5_9LEPT|nr:hypothetical protein LEP1GSC043_3134 [Leptospira weilii str. Ecochallenge]
MKQTFKPSFLLLSFCWIFHGCGVALTPKLTAKLPPETETEVFRLDIFHGEVKNLYGLNIGIKNYTNRLIGAQIGIVNVAKNSIGVQVGIVNLSNKKHMDGSSRLLIRPKKMDYSRFRQELQIY